MTREVVLEAPGGGLGGADRAGAARGVVRERRRARPRARRRRRLPLGRRRGAPRVVEEVEPERRFAFRWDDEGRVEIELEEVDEGTRPSSSPRPPPPAGPTALSLRALALVHACPTRGVFDALADPTRRHLVEALALRETATATELAAELPVTRQAVAKHLTAMRDAGLVERKSGRETRYRLDPGAARRGRRVDGPRRRRVGCPPHTPARSPWYDASWLGVHLRRRRRPLHAEPDASSEQVTQALRGGP